MARKVIIALLGGILISSALIGCEKPEVAEPETAIVEANQPYLQNFGEPPAVKQGRGFARVGYLPLREAPGKVSPIPLFLFKDRDQLPQMLNRLVSSEIFLPPGSPLYQPFPADLQVDVAPPEKGNLIVALTTKQTLDAQELAAIALTLTETAVQFAEVERVSIFLNGEPLAQMPPNGYLHDPQAVVPVEPPAIIMIAGMWEKGAETVDEILINFDRPVKVNRFHLSDASGSKVEGDYFTSAFDMAVVVHPKSPEDFQEGTVLRAEWDVTDALGRSNSGVNSLPLRRFEH